MTTEIAIAVLTEAVAIHANGGFDVAVGHYLDLSGLDDALLATEPFARLKHAWIFHPMGGGGNANLVAAYWAVEKIRAGLKPSEIVELANNELAENVIRYSEVSPVYGCSTEREIVFEDGLRLINPAAIPAAWYDHDFMTPLVTGFLPPDECSVLCQDVQLAPAMVARSSAEEAPPKDEALIRYDSHLQKRLLIRAAILLASTSSVEIPVTTWICEGNSPLLGRSRAKYGSLSCLPPTSAITVDASAIERNYKALLEFSPREPLLRAIDRLGRARLNILDADCALDLGLSAEIILMHDTNQSNSRRENTEIRYKLGSRAAWLIGTDVNSRSKVFEEIRKLYDSRSAAAHSGMLSSNQKFKRNEAIELVRSLIEKILLWKTFPNWNTLILGGM